MIDIETVEQWRARRNRDEAFFPAQDDLPDDSGWHPAAPIPPPRMGVLRPPVAEDQSRSRGLPQAGNALPSARGEPGLLPVDPSPNARSQPMIVEREPDTFFSTSPESFRTAPVRIPTVDELQDAPPIVIMRWLLVEDAAVLAKETLVKRGFSQLEIRVARQIVDPDPAVRLALAQALPNIAVNDSRPWLLWLSRDTDAKVRRATVAILATDPDPALQERLLELELEETDASVLAVVKQALENRRRGL